MTSLRPAPRRTAPRTRPISVPRGRIAWEQEGALRWTARDHRGGFVALVERVDGLFVPMTATGELLDPCGGLAAAQAAVVPIAPARAARPDRTRLVMHLAGAGGALALIAAVADMIVR